MPASSYKKQAKKMTMSKKRLRPGEKLIEGAKFLGSIGAEFAKGTIKNIEKNMKNDKSKYSFISGLINDILKCLAMDPPELKTFLKEQIDIDDDFLERINVLATSKNIINNRLDECFSKSISKHHTKIKKFFDLNKFTKESDLLHIIAILKLLLDKLRLPEVDRVAIDFDDYEKRLIESIMVQFIDPCSILMGISFCDEQSRFDFMKEWVSHVYPTIDPDISFSLTSGSKKKSKRKKSKRKSKKKKSKKRKSKKKAKKAKKAKKTRKR